MRIEIIGQTALADVARRRVGDVICAALDDSRHDRFRFAVAYMRVSGLGRLVESMKSLRSRGGSVSGIVGIDGRVTSFEALEMLASISSNSRVFHTVSDLIWHPKLYLISGRDHAVVIIGSANLTRDGLYRNIELAAEMEFDLGRAEDEAILRPYLTLMDALLDTQQPNTISLTPASIRKLSRLDLVRGEGQTPEPEVFAKRHGPRLSQAAAAVFPPLSVPLAPPLESAGPRALTRRTGARGQVTPRSASTFVMKLSAFDSSHRTGVPGTPEVLVPHAAVPFFPRLSVTDRKFPDAMFRVLLNTPTGTSPRTYRLWYYETRATGKKIDEYRLRMDHTTIDLSTTGGGDLLVISKRSGGSDLPYEVTVVRQGDRDYERFSLLCDRTSQGKSWGLR